jgi:hypothetical protein
LIGEEERGERGSKSINRMRSEGSLISPITSTSNAAIAANNEAVFTVCVKRGIKAKKGTALQHKRLSIEIDTET